jgi:hypothetical protein
MKRCAKCDSEYDDAYDACPNCARIAAPAPTAPKRPVWPWIVGAIVILAVIGVVGMGSCALVAVPVFSSASSSAQQKSCFANQRTIVGAALTYQQMNPGAAVPSDWSGLMRVLVPDVLKREPTCPAGGTYSADSSSGALKVSCSIHGSALP